MEALRIIKRIEDNVLTLNIPQFNGKECEILVIPFEESKKNQKLPLPQRNLGEYTNNISREFIYENER